jgi:hypothetical protein
MPLANNLSRQFQAADAHQIRPNHPPLQPLGQQAFWGLADPENKNIFLRADPEK